MTDSERQQVVKTLTDKILEKGFMKLNQVSPTLQAASIDRSIYGGQGPKKWLKVFFPEFIVEGSNGKEIVLLAADRGKVEVARILTEYLSQEKSILFAKIPDELLKHNINYKEYSEGKGLKIWLRQTFPQFEESEDGLSLVLSGNPPHISKPEAPKTAPGPEHVEEVRQMHAMAFMNWWSANLKQLRQYGALGGISDDELKDRVALRMAAALLSGSGEILDAAGDEEPRIAFRTGLFADNGSEIYCVLGVNPRNEDNTKQFWALEGFCCIGENSDLGTWLRGRFALPSPSRPTLNYAQLIEQLDAIDGSRAGLADEIRAFLDALDSGTEPAPGLSDSIRAYEKQWAAFHATVGSFPSLTLESPLRISALREQLDEKNALAREIRQALEAFDALTDGLAALYEELHLENGPDATPRRDRAAVHALYDTVPEDADLAPFEAAVQPYRSLLTVMSASRLTDEVDLEVERVTAHFSEITYRFALRALVGSEEKDYAFLAPVQAVFDALAHCAAMHRDALAPADECDAGVDPDELLSEVVNADRMWPAKWVGCFRRVLPEGDAERAVVLGDYAALKRLSPDFVNGLDAALSSEMTPYAAGMRLLAYCGGQGRAAEQYLLLGLQYDAERCAPVLLRLYREEERAQDFEAVWVRYSDTVAYTNEDRLYWFRILCDNAPSDAIEFAEVNLYLQYRPEFLELLAEAARKTNAPEKASVYARRLERLSALPEPNPFEKALIQADSAAVTEFIGNPSLLLSLGYSESEVTRICKTGESGSFSQGSSLYETGLRLYAFQRNRNGLAEQYFWRGLPDGWTGRCSQLLVLLTQEKRWDESRALYECYAAALSKDLTCRKLYLIARIFSDSEAIQTYISENLVDFFSLINDMPYIRSVVEAKVESGENSSFYTELLKVTALLDDPFLKSVILMDRNLRETVHDHDLLIRTGFEPQQIEAIAALYMSENYPRGSDVLSVAERVFLFARLYAGAAETIVRLSAENARKNRLLWSIYTLAGREDKQLALLEGDEALRGEHEPEYLRILFRQERYARFAEEYGRMAGEAGGELRLMDTIVRLELGLSVPDELPDLTGVQTPEAHRLFARLVGAAYAAGRSGLIRQMLFPCFEQWTGCLTREELNGILTGAGSLPEEEMRRIQEEALLNGHPELAIYYYTNLHVGEIADEAEAYYAQAVQSVSGPESSRRLKLLYASRASELDARMMAVALEETLNSGLDPKELAKRVHELLTDADISAGGLAQVYTMLEGQEICLNYLIYSELTRLSEQLHMEEQNLRFFHSYARRAVEGGKTYFLSHLVQVYLDALEKGCFPPEFRDDAITVCNSIITLSKNPAAALCVFYFEEAAGHPHYAAVALYYLATLPEGSVPEKTAQHIKELVSSQWNGAVPSILALFKDMLHDCTIEQIRAYLSFSGEFFATDPGTFMRLKASASDSRMFSDAESTSALKLLFTEPYNSEYWELCTNIPLDDDPIGYSKFFYIYCETHPDHWQKYVMLFDGQRIDDLVLRALIRWAGTPGDAAASCRKFLEQQLDNNDGYLSRWSGSESAVELVSALCAQLDVSISGAYASLKAISLIAVKLGRADCLAYVRDHLGSYLFGSYGDLGVVVSCHLLLSGRTEEAHEWLLALTRVVGTMKYQELVRTLSGLTAEQLDEWAAEEENQIFLRLVLPNGNMPNLQQINLIVYEGVMQNKAAQTAHVLLRILDMFPDDYCTFNALFDLCCTQFDGFLPILHHTLMYLTVTPGNGNFYRHTQTDYAAMLAALNAVLIARNMTSVVDDGYDFNESAGDYYRKYSGVLLSTMDVSFVNQCQENVLNDLRNRSGEDLNRYCDAYICCITGNWINLLKDAWESRNVGSEFYLAIGRKVEPFDFSRSILRVVLSLPANEQGNFIEWLMINAGRQKERKNQIQFVREFLRHEGTQPLLAQRDCPLEELLRFPFEDYSLYSLYSKKVLIPAQESGVKYLGALAWMTGALCCHDNVMTDFSKRADFAYQANQDEIACCYYFALHKVCRRFRIVNKLLIPNSRQTESQKANRMSRQAESYEALYRITGVFSGDEDVMEKVGSSQFHIWSAINLVLALINGERADEILRLRQYLAPAQAEAADIVLEIMNPDVSDEAKLARVKAIGDNVTKAYASFILKHPFVPRPSASYPGPTKAWQLHSMEASYEANTIYMNTLAILEDTRSGAVINHKLRMVLVCRQANAKAFSPRDPSIWWKPSKSFSAGKGTEFILPGFAQDIEPVTSGTEEDISALQIRRDGLMQLQLRESFVQRAELSREILARTIGMNLSAREKYNALLQYSVDYYYAIYTGQVEDRAKAHTVIKELLSVPNCGVSSGGPYNELLELVRSLALLSLIKSYSSIREMAVDYSKDRAVFHRMRGMLNDSVVIPTVTTIFEVLGDLGSCYAVYSPTNAEPLRHALQQGYKKLSMIKVNSWTEVKTFIQRLINEEVNSLDQRPIIEKPVLFNKGLQPEVGYFSGMVSNAGLEAADDVTLQVTFGENGRSRQYFVKHLEPRSEAAFEVKYAVEPGARSMPYQIDIAYAYQGKTETVTPLSDQFEIGEIGELDIPINPYGTDGSVSFITKPGTGEVYSPNFFGRREETAKLRALVQGGFFPDYHNAIVYGVRRTGKTSLLNYFCEYVTSHVEDAVCIQIDVQGSNYTIQDIFIDKVIAFYPQGAVADSEKWQEFSARWKTFSTGLTDRDPKDLKRFYTELRAVTGKGLILVIDEIDRLFKRITDNQSQNGPNLDNGLFDAITSMLDDAQCARAVHFVICGSNWLIRYSGLGSSLQQMFQKFGDNRIEVGRLPERDVKDMLSSACTRYPVLEYTQEALRLIWDYTGGLVWFAKLLGNAVIRRARSRNRGIIYPYDVLKALPEVLSDNNCKQFYEGCSAGSPEWKLIDAMQSLANRKDIYVSVGQICHLLECNPDDAEQSLRTLQLFKIVEGHPTDPTLYRFSLDIYRRYFRSTKTAFERLPDEMDEFIEKQEVRVSAPPAEKAADSAGAAEAAPALQPDLPMGDQELSTDTDIYGDDEDVSIY